MDSSNPMEGGQASAGTGASVNADDWRSQLQPGVREGNIKELLEIIAKYIQVTEQYPMEYLEKHAKRMEDRIYSDATRAVLAPYKFEDKENAQRVLSAPHARLSPQQPVSKIKRLKRDFRPPSMPNPLLSG